MLAAGADPILLGIARDDLDETRRLLGAALESDVVITSGGVSVGDYDFVKQVQDELGVERRFWGVATKPGKPLAFGTRGDTLVFGVPGNPVAAMVSFEMYVRPALLALQGRQDVYRALVLRCLGGTGPANQEPDGGAHVAASTHEHGAIHFTTTGPQGSGILSSMAGAEGLFFVPPGHPAPRRARSCSPCSLPAALRSGRRSPVVPRYADRRAVAGQGAGSARPQRLLAARSGRAFSRVAHTMRRCAALYGGVHVVSTRP